MFAQTSNFGNVAFDKIKDLILADAGTVGTRLTIQAMRAESDDTVADSSGTIYLVPDQHAFIPLFDGRRFVPREVPYEFTGASSNAIMRAVSLDVDESGLALAFPNTYDIYAKYDRASGMPVLTVAKWSSATARFSSIPQTPWMHPDGLGFFRGRLVRCMGKDAPGSGDAVLMPDQLYVGTIYTTSIPGIGAPRGVYDSYLYRHLWNFYNQKRRRLKVVDTTDSWSYNSATIRAWNNSTNNRVGVVLGMSVPQVFLDFRCFVASSATPKVGIGLDSTTANSADLVLPTTGGGGAAQYSITTATFDNKVGLGYHYLQLLESVIGAVASTFYGDNGATMQSGALGYLFA